MFTGSLRTDLFTDFTPAQERSNGQSAYAYEDPLNTKDRKSPFLAGALSAAVPGTGEIYSESYLKGAVFLAAEVIGWAINIAYNRKGDRATSDFQNFADANWSVAEYASWLNTNKGCNIPIIMGDPSLPPWKRVDWAELNKCERELGGIFSHTLPVYGDQQYYELIGKYPQYNPGWRDADRSHVSEDNISGLFKSYSLMRGHANDLYDVASTVVIVVVINHILSAADGAWSASRYNSFHSELGLKMRDTPLGSEIVPTATLHVTW